MRRVSIAGLEVSVLTLGAAGFGGVGSARRLIGQGESEAEAHALLDCAAGLGIDHLDTAATYGDGASEKILGSWLRTLGSSARTRIRVTSKVGLRGGLGRSHVLAEAERSLMRLGVDALDFYLAHVPDPLTPWAEVAETFEQLVGSGKVRRWGVSNVRAADLSALAALRCRGLALVQNQLNLLHREDLDEARGALAACRRHGLAYAAYSPLAGGLLGGKYALDAAPPRESRIALRPDLYAGAWTPANARRVTDLRRQAEARGVSLAGLAVGWLLGVPGVASIALGVRRPAQLETLVAEAAIVADAVAAEELSS